MSFSASLKLGTTGQSILNVKLQSCNSDCSSCTDIPGYDNVLVSSFPTSGLTVNNIPDTARSIKAIALGATCSDVVQCISISNIPGLPTATPIPPTATPIPPTATPIPPTATPIPPTATPIPPTATPIPPTATPIPPTPTPLPGTCYEMAIPDSLLTNNGQDMYIIYQKTDNTISSYSYNQFFDSGENNGYYTLNVCSKTYPSIKYGASGFEMIPDASIIVTIGNGCITSVDCGGNDPTPPPPPPTATPIVGDSGLCYTYTLTQSEITQYSELSVQYTALGTSSPVTVNATNGVQSTYNVDGTSTFYICSKTNINFIQNGGSVVPNFLVDQNGACDAENDCSTPIVPTPTPIPPTATPVPPTATPVGSTGNCVTFSESISSGLSDGCGGFQRTDATITATLKDAQGNTINATEGITISFPSTYSDELGTNYSTVSVVINSGNSTGTATYTQSSYEIGPFSSQCTPVSTSVDLLSPTITGSNGGTYTVCPTT